MAEMKWLSGNRIQVAPPKKPKKITATRLATILGLNPWSTSFEVWCAITRTYEEPFTDTIYTIAGKTIEPKQIAYMRKAYGMTNLRTPTDIYGKDYFKKTWGDFFGDIPIFGGMWDSLLVDPKERPEVVIEYKTTKRSEDWADDIPEYYAIQAALYAYLLGIDDVIMVPSFLSEGDYENPENFVPSASNTITQEFKVSQRYPNFDLMLEKAKKWWEDHVVTGISPAYDEKKDAEILKVLRTNNPNPDDDMSALIAEAEGLKKELDEAYAGLAEKEKRLKVITEAIKKFAMDKFRPGDKKVAVPGTRYSWTVSKTDSTELDKDALKADGLLDKYTKPKTTYRITVSENKPE